MNTTQASQLSNQQQITLQKNTFLSHSQNLSTSFDTTKNLKEIMAAATTARVHRQYLRDEMLYSSKAKTTQPRKTAKKKS